MSFVITRHYTSSVIMSFVTTIYASCVMMIFVTTMYTSSVKLLFVTTVYTSHLLTGHSGFFSETPDTGRGSGRERESCREPRLGRPGDN